MPFRSKPGADISFWLCSFLTSSSATEGCGIFQSLTSPSPTPSSQLLSKQQAPSLGGSVRRRGRDRRARRCARYKKCLVLRTHCWIAVLTSTAHTHSSPGCWTKDQYAQFFLCDLKRFSGLEHKKERKAQESGVGLQDTYYNVPVHMDKLTPTTLPQPVLVIFSPFIQ